jgi:hypothetical protein
LQKQLGSESDQVVAAAFIAMDFFDGRTLKERIGLAADSFAPFSPSAMPSLLQPGFLNKSPRFQ